jgi:voltage-gated potassium channel
MLIVILGSVENIHNRYGSIIFKTELTFTVLFFIEYVLRIYSARKPEIRLQFLWK